MKGSQRIRLDRAVYSTTTFQTTSAGKRNVKAIAQYKKLAWVSISQRWSAVFLRRAGKREAPEVSSPVETRPRLGLN